MRKTENSFSDFVQPDFASEEITIVERYLQNAGFSDTDVKWLVPIIKRSDCLGDASGTSLDRMFSEYFHNNSELQWIVEELGAPIQTEEDRQTRLALLFGSLLYLSRYNRSGTPNVDHEKSGQASNFSEWIGEFQKHAAFSAEYLDFYKLDRVRNKPVLIFDELIRFLFPEEGVPLNQVLDMGLLTPIPLLLRSNKSHYNDPKRLEFWFRWHFFPSVGSVHKDQHSPIAKLDTLLPIFSDFSDDILGAKIIGLLEEINGAMLFDSSRLLEQGLNPLNTAWRLVAHELIPFFELLDAKTPEKNREHSYLLKAWWHISRVIYDSRMGGLKNELSQELRNRLVESAAKHIGILRSVLRDSPEDFNKEDSRGVPVFDFYAEAFDTLLAFAKPWKRLRPLLLAFSAMNRPAVASDLRAWPAFEKEPPPDPYARVARWIAIGMYPEHLREELDRDPHLQGLREEFAKFCLERLRTEIKNKDSGYTNEDFKEPRPVWRRCYVEALAALRVNPGGRAHRTLFWLLNNDPDERVRELAKKAHKRVRHLDRKKPNLDKGASPRKPLFEAFWRMRKAHLITLGVEIDGEGAMRTRQSELRRTLEKDDR